MTFGTLKYPAPGCGALARAASLPNGGTGTSARSVAVSPASKSTWDMGSTPVGIHFVEAIHVLENSVEVGLQPGGLRVGEGQIGQACDVAHFLFGNLHACAFFRESL